MLNAMRGCELRQPSSPRIEIRVETHFLKIANNPLDQFGLGIPGGVKESSARISAQLGYGRGSSSHDLPHPVRFAARNTPRRRLGGPVQPRRGAAGRKARPGRQPGFRADSSANLGARAAG